MTFHESAAHLRVLRECGLTGVTGQVDRPLQQQGQLVLEVIKEAEPDLEELVDQLMDDDKRPPTAWFQELCGRGHRYTTDGATFNGRECCARFAARIQARLMYFAVPSEHACPDCGTTYMLKLAVRSV